MGQEDLTRDRLRAFERNSNSTPTADVAAAPAAAASDADASAVDDRVVDWMKKLLENLKKREENSKGGKGNLKRNQEGEERVKMGCIFNRELDLCGYLYYFGSR